MHGRRDPTLRDPNTLRALAALAEEGYVAQADADALADAYGSCAGWSTVSRSCAICKRTICQPIRTRDGRSPGRSDCPTPVRSRTSTSGRPSWSAAIHERLFYRPLLEAFAGPVAPSPGVDRPATEELLSGLGFASTSQSFEVLRRLVDPGTRMGKVLAHVFPVMVPALALASNPDQALVRLERISDAVGNRHGPADALAADPAAALRLAHVAAASAFATDLLVAAPERLTALAAAGPTIDAQAALVSAVARYASRELQPRETGAALADVADRVVREAVEAAEPDLPFAVIGMGKLGARELNVASDLDLVFVYEGEGSDDMRRAVGVAERVMRAIRDAGWEPDADLRPEGRNGALARSLAGYLEYWERYAQLWEFQALLRARHVAGDGQLGRRFVLNAGDFAYPLDGITVDRVAEIRRMRERIERERVKPPEAAKFHFKLGYGSLSDVQFAVEVSLMRFGGAHPELRTNRTLEAVERLAEQRFLEQSVARDLGEGFVFLSDVKNALEVDRRLHAEAIPPDPDDQVVLARRLGYEEYPRQSFIDDYLRVTRRARRAMERVFHEDAL